MRDFSQWMSEHQSAWRRTNINTDECGTQGGRAYPWILPATRWEEGLWPGLRAPSPNAIAQYLARENAEKHTGAHNLKSSWIACANLYFPFRTAPEDRSLLARFLSFAVADEIQTLERVELEYAEDGALHPAMLLGETGGRRGKGQTSPDLAFLVNGGAGIVLTESKLTEHSFYSCSARRREDKPGRAGNPDPLRCTSSKMVAENPEGLCHQVAWGRRYWYQLKDAVDRDAVANLRACPAAFSGYQLFRQQALAEGYSQRYALAVSAVAYDARNQELIDSLRSTGIDSFPAGWAALFRGRSRFAAWTHQAWVQWVRQYGGEKWSAWLAWVEARYGYKSFELGAPKASA